MTRTYRVFMYLLLISFASCKVNYSFTGASISPDIKTINIKLFNKTSALGPTTLPQIFTEKLKDKFTSQTSLGFVTQNADLTLEGTISGYVVTPLAIQQNEQAARNRLTI